MVILNLQNLTNSNHCKYRHGWNPSVIMFVTTPATPLNYADQGGFFYAENLR